MMIGVTSSSKTLIGWRQYAVSFSSVAKLLPAQHGDVPERRPAHSGARRSRGRRLARGVLLPDFGERVQERPSGARSVEIFQLARPEVLRWPVWQLETVGQVHFVVACVGAATGIGPCRLLHGALL